MCKKIVCLASIVLVFSLSAAVSYGQEVYEFDGGGDGTSWSDPNNWEEVTDPNGNPGSGNPATAPAATTFANIPQLGVVITPGSTALVASIGTAAGAGSASLGAGASLTTGGDVAIGVDPNGTANTGLLTMTGGTLSASGGGADIEVGLTSPGTMNMSGGAASAADDLSIRIDSVLNMTGGTIDIGDRLNMTDNAILNNDGGTIIAQDDFFFFDDSRITIDSGLMEVKDKMRFDFDPNAFTGPKLTINGGIVRTQEYNFDITTIDDFEGVTEINGDGLLQVRQEGGSGLSELSIGLARALIAEGVHLTTSELAPLKLGAFSVVVPSSLQGTNVTFTQISVVPEPASFVLLGLGSLGLLLRRKRAL